jgi:hypothetical protein
MIRKAIGRGVRDLNSIIHRKDAQRELCPHPKEFYREGAQRELCPQPKEFYREAAVSNFKWFGVDILDSM